MRKLLFCLALFMFSATGAFAQPSSATVYKDWSPHFESKKMFDVSYRVVKCEGADQIHLLVFNENSVNQTVAFTVEVTDESTGASFSKDISFDALKMMIYKASCSANDNPAVLKIALPNSYTPSKVKANITFKP